jgi:hypothetical protein
MAEDNYRYDERRKRFERISEEALNRRVAWRLALAFVVSVAVYSGIVIIRNLA